MNSDEEDDDLQIPQQVYEKPPISMNLIVSDCPFKVCVGNGNQTIKWLAIFGSTLYNDMKSNEKPQSKTLRTALIKDKGISHQIYTPSAVRFSEGSHNIIHPDIHIRDIFPQGGTVLIELQKEAPLNEFGEPIYSLWRRIAFNTSENTKQDLPDIATLDLQDRIIYRDFDRLSYVYNPIQTPQEIAYAIQQDFKRIHIEDIVTTYEELRVITNAFLNNFQFLNKLFELYSYPNHFILEEHLDSLFSRLENTDIPFDYYNTIRRGEMEYIDNKYSRYEFFELIIRLFYHKNMIDDSAPLVQLISDGIKIFVKSIKKIFTSMTLDALLSNKVQPVLVNNIDYLKKIYDHYSKTSSKYITLGEFAKFINDIGLNPNNQENVAETMRNLYDRETSHSIILDKLIFPDFLEAFAKYLCNLYIFSNRCCINKPSKVTTTISDKIVAVLNDLENYVVKLKIA